MLPLLCTDKYFFSCWTLLDTLCPSWLEYFIFLLPWRPITAISFLTPFVLLDCQNTLISSGCSLLDTPFTSGLKHFFFAALKAHYFNFLLDTFCTSGLPKHMGCEESSSYKCLSLLYSITNNLVINKFKAGIAPSLRLVVSAFPYFKLSKSASKWQNASSQCIEKSLSIFTGVSRYLPALLPGIYRELSIFTGIYRELSIFTGKYREMSHDIFSLDIFCHTGHCRTNVVSILEPGLLWQASFPNKGGWTW